MRSLARQTLTGLEVVVIDDGSTPAASPTWDGEQPIRILELDGQGPGAARAAGLDAAAGTFVTYCDDDDGWLPEHLAALRAYLERHPRMALADGDSAWTYAAGTEAVPYSVDHDVVVDAAARRPFDPTTRRPPRRELVWHSIINPHPSFGSVARRLLPALERQGVDVVVAPSRIQPARGLERFHRALDRRGRFVFCSDYRQHPAVLLTASWQRASPCRSGSCITGSTPTRSGPSSVPTATSSRSARSATPRHARAWTFCCMSSRRTSPSKSSSTAVGR